MVAWPEQFRGEREEEGVAVQVDTLCARDVSMQNKQPQARHSRIIAGIRLARATPPPVVLAL